MKKIKILLNRQKLNSTAQIAHLVFADPQRTHPEKPKELFIANPHRTIIDHPYLKQNKLLDKNELK